MPEHQNIEYKESWRDEYLKEICAFANANGGTIYIGCDDHGNVKGVNKYKKLLDDIPNQTKDFLGILIDVNLHESDGKHYIEAIVPQSDVPISFKGRYYIRSGSTAQEMRSASLNEFLLKKSGKTWDDLPEPDASVKAIDDEAVKFFIQQAVYANRITQGAEKENTQNILENLHLVNDSGQLKRAALLLFGKDPLKYVPASSFKIGRFGKSDSDLRFQDVVEGDLIRMPDKVMERLQSKYLVANISYEGIHRKEELEYPESALREAILNAIIHKDYSGSQIQLSIYDNKLMIWNPGQLPEGLSIEMLKGKHPSRPRNKNIADTLFKAGYIEAWGRGFALIFDECRYCGCPEPSIEEFAGGIQITLHKSIFNEEHLKNVGLKERQIKALLLLKQQEHLSNDDFQEVAEVSRRTATRDLNELVEKGILKPSGTKGAGATYMLK